MIEFNLTAFTRDIESEIIEAGSLVSNREEIMDKQTYLHNIGKSFQEIDEIIDEERRFTELLLETCLLRIKLKLQFGFESLGLQTLLNQFLEDWKDWGNHDKINSLALVPYVGVLDSITLNLLKRYFSVFQTQLDSHDYKIENKKERLYLEQILRATPKIIFDSKLDPKNETDIHKKMNEILSLVFPYTTRNFPIPTNITTYKPDFGIKNLKSAIEYKFVANEDDSKKFIGGIYEDVHAYESEDWKYFYAVIYLTEPFLTQEQVEANFKSAKIPDNWIPIVVNGKGERILPKIKASKTIKIAKTKGTK
jgi:hypothetical protein